MTKKRLRNFIMTFIPSDKTEEEIELIAGEIMKKIGKSSLNTKVSQTNDKGLPGVFYDTKDARIFREEIKNYLEQSLIPKKEQSLKLPSPGKLEEKLEPTPSKTTSNKEEYAPPLNQISAKESCRYLGEKYGIKISQGDLKKIMKKTPLTRQSLNDAHRFKMFEIILTELVEPKYHAY